MTVALSTPLSQILLSPGSAITVAGVSWPQYQLVLTELGDDRATRLTYDDGVLEIRMPSQFHEIVNRLLSRIIFTLAEELGLDIVDLGSTTWNRADLDQGIEPDGCFLIQNAHRVTGLNPELPMDLAPDLAIEVDIASASDRKLGIYQALGVPELWLYRKGQTQILDLHQGIHSVERSLAFPGISKAQLQAWVAMRETTTDIAVVKAVRQFCRGIEAPSPGPEI
jgi:Uma2 family endonuclease